MGFSALHPLSLKSKIAATSTAEAHWRGWGCARVKGPVVPSGAMNGVWLLFDTRVDRPHVGPAAAQGPGWWRLREMPLEVPTRKPPHQGDQLAVKRSSSMAITEQTTERSPVTVRIRMRQSSCSLPLNYTHRHAVPAGTPSAQTCWLR